MEAEVIKSFKQGIKEFIEGEIVEIDADDEAIFYNTIWICDVPSPFFNRHFKLNE